MSNLFTPAPKLSPDQSPSPLQYKGVGGWLLFFCISITILSPLLTLGNLLTGWNDGQRVFEYFPAFFAIMVVDTVLSLCLTAFGIFTGICLWRIRPGAVQKAKLYLFIYLGYQVVSSVLPYMAGLPAAVNQAISQQTVKSIMQGSVYFAIWFTYLVKSKRVQNTYFMI